MYVKRYPRTGRLITRTIEGKLDNAVATLNMLTSDTNRYYRIVFTGGAGNRTVRLAMYDAELVDTGGYMIKPDTRTFPFGEEFVTKEELYDKVKIYTRLMYPTDEEERHYEYDD